MAGSSFTLNQKLKEDTAEVTRLGLSLVLLVNDRSVPWLILVPRRSNVREIYGLSMEDRAVLIEEIALASKIITGRYNPDKINIGSLGNIVPQLHIHVIGRFKNDRAWPGPIWGSAPMEPYGDKELKAECSVLKEAFRQNPKTSL